MDLSPMNPLGKIMRAARLTDTIAVAKLLHCFRLVLKRAHARERIHTHSLCVRIMRAHSHSFRHHFS